MKLIDERFRSLGFTPRNGNNDAMLLKNVALFNEVNGVKKVTHRIDVEFYGYANADNSKVGLMAYMNVNGKIYRGMIYGNKSDSLENYEEYVVFDSKFQRSLENVSNGLHLFPAPPSHSKIKRFFRCLGSELKHGCTSECSANTLKECAIAGGTVGTVIGAAVGSAIPAAGTAVGAAVGAVWGFITCLGWTCGKCAFGGFLECFALFF